MRRFIAVYAQKKNLGLQISSLGTRSGSNGRLGRQPGSIRSSRKNRRQFWIGSTNSEGGDSFETRSLQLP
jgi:hypothetical protein